MLPHDLPRDRTSCRQELWILQREVSESATIVFRGPQSAKHGFRPGVLSARKEAQAVASRLQAVAGDWQALGKARGSQSVRTDLRSGLRKKDCRMLPRPLAVRMDPRLGLAAGSPVRNCSASRCACLLAIALPATA